VLQRKVSRVTLDDLDFCRQRVALQASITRSVLNQLPPEENGPSAAPERRPQPATCFGRLFGACYGKSGDENRGHGVVQTAR
jgi:hypothetical protein